MDPHPLFGGVAGEQVPAADSEDVKAAWALTREVEKTHPGRQVGIGTEIFERTCRPGADIQAVFYRASMITMLLRVAPELQDQLDAVFRAAAEIPMEWMGVGTPRRGFPFDAEDFMRRVREGDSQPM